MSIDQKCWVESGDTSHGMSPYAIEALANLLDAQDRMGLTDYVIGVPEHIKTPDAIAVILCHSYVYCRPDNLLRSSPI